MGQAYFAGLDTIGTLGLISDNGDGIFDYDPRGAFENLDAGDSATDSFSYTLSDGNGGTDTATVTVTITGQSETTGTDAGETLVGTDDAEELDAMGGDDVVDSRGGGDTVTLGSGADTLVGAPTSIFGDIITDFSEEDRIVFEGVEFARRDVTVGGDPVVISVDADQDGTPDGSFTVLGDFSSGEFMAVAKGDTTITFETFLPALQDGQAVDPNVANGIINQFLQGDGETDFRMTLRDLGLAGYDNVVGVYEVTADGTLTDARVLIKNANADKSAEVTIGDVESGNKLGFFIVQDAAEWASGFTDADSFEFVNSDGDTARLDDGADIFLAVNGVRSSETVFHSYAEELNVDGVQHSLSGVNVGGETISVGFEDLTDGGGRDYEDVVFSIARVTADEFAFL